MIRVSDVLSCLGGSVLTLKVVLKGRKKPLSLGGTKTKRKTMLCAYHTRWLTIFVFFFYFSYSAAYINCCRREFVLSSGWLASYSGSVGGACINYSFFLLFLVGGECCVRCV